MTETANSPECFHCHAPASGQYTLVLESGTVIENKWVCEECVSGFQSTDWMEVHEAPVLMRKNGEGEE